MAPGVDSWWKRFDGYYTFVDFPNFIMITGLLGEVRNLTSNATSSTIDLSWEQPSSLNLSAADPDVVYCVDVYKTDTASFHILRNCSVFKPYYKFSLDNPDPKEVFTFTITPRSNVNGAQDGIATTINATFLYDSKLTAIYV